MIGEPSPAVPAASPSGGGNGGDAAVPAQRRGDHDRQAGAKLGSPLPAQPHREPAETDGDAALPAGGPANGGRPGGWSAADARRLGMARHLTDPEYEEAISAFVASAPPLPEDVRSRLARLLRTGECHDPTDWDQR